MMTLTESERLIERVLAENENFRRPDGSYVLAEAALAALLRTSEEARVKAETSWRAADKAMVDLTIRAEAAETALADMRRERDAMAAQADKWIIALEDSAHQHGIPVPDEITSHMRAARSRKPDEEKKL